MFLIISLPIGLIALMFLFSEAPDSQYKPRTIKEFLKMKVEIKFD